MNLTELLRDLADVGKHVQTLAPYLPAMIFAYLWYWERDHVWAILCSASFGLAYLLELLHPQAKPFLVSPGELDFVTLLRAVPAQRRLAWHLTVSGLSSVLGLIAIGLCATRFFHMTASGLQAVQILILALLASGAAAQTTVIIITHVKYGRQLYAHLLAGHRSESHEPPRTP